MQRARAVQIYCQRSTMMLIKSPLHQSQFVMWVEYQGVKYQPIMPYFDDNWVAFFHFQLVYQPQKTKYGFVYCENGFKIDDATFFLPQRPLFECVCV